MSKRTSTASMLGSIDLFSGLTKKELSLIQSLMSALSISPGTEFIREGTAGREAFIIVSGEASVWRGGRLVASVGPGAVMGEMAVLAGTLRTATVKAETEMMVEVLTAGEFSALLDKTPRMARKLLATTLGRLQQLDPSLLS